MTAKRDEELTQEFTEWMALGIEHDAHVFAWLQASNSRVLEYLRKKSEHAKLAKTPDELTIYNMEWELSDKDDEIAQLKAQLDLHPTAAVPLETTPLSSPQDEKVSIPAIVVTSTAQSLEAPAPVMTASDRPAPQNTIVHSIKTRRDALTPVIEFAQSQCRDATDTAEVWAALQVFAEKKIPPLRGATEDGLQYLKNGNAASFNRESLRKRLGR